MASPRIYSPQPLHAGSDVVLTGNAANHLTRVLRLTAGDELRLFHGDGQDYIAQIEGPVRGGLRVRVQSARPVATESGLKITLMQGICRGQKMDLVIQKATELGVTSILPLRCERSVVRLQGERALRRRDHWFGIAAAAAEQCGRAIVPKVHPATTVDDAVASLPTGSTRLLLDPAADSGLARQAPADGIVVLLAGPEGGLTPGERSIALQAGFTGVRLGPRVLRTETAPLAALSVVQYLYGDLGGG
ncbi:MAG: 16S rRNA (uracil(1498)-N(3))-methyltransferase [Chromatiales bacterium]|nr:MAG: 16S rRNA (uracil(1498)-N(3))-methyltransferase [Chromatiales bacterium]